MIFDDEDKNKNQVEAFLNSQNNDAQGGGPDILRISASEYSMINDLGNPATSIMSQKKTGY